MSTPRILVVYGTSHGQTAKIAQRMADALMAMGATVTLVDADHLPRRVDVRGFDGVIAGSSVNYDHHRRSVTRFARAHRNALNAMPSAFVSVSGAAAGRTETERAKAEHYVDDFLRQTGWRPGPTCTMAGAMAYTKYNPLLRWLTKHAAAKGGGPTDTSRDHEFTDWAQVQRFAQAFAAMVRERGATRAPITA